eukprot:1196055-Prorocentrum_minimum.AAC.5
MQLDRTAGISDLPSRDWFALREYPTSPHAIGSHLAGGGGAGGSREAREGVRGAAGGAGGGAPPRAGQALRGHHAWHRRCRAAAGGRGGGARAWRATHHRGEGRTETEKTGSSVRQKKFEN